MGRGRGGSYSGSRTNDFDVKYDFELFPLDNNGVKRKPIVTKGKDGVKTYTFPGAIENFQARFRDVDDKFKLDVINITNKFTQSGESATLDSPITLNLTARYIPVDTKLSLLDGTPIIQSSDSDSNGKLDDNFKLFNNQIEIILSSPKLKNIGINELAFVIPDQDTDSDGFQINGNTIDPNQAIKNIESIQDILAQAFLASDLGDNEFPGIRVSGESKNEENTIVSTQNTALQPTVPIIIEAETLTLDTYAVEDFSRVKTVGGIKTADAKGISLFNVAGNEGTASLVAGDTLSGVYDLTVNYFDENDGEAKLEVFVNDKLIDGLSLDAKTSSGFPTEDTRREWTIENLDIKTGDTITIKGIADVDPKGSEWARVDYITFEKDTLPNNNAGNNLV